MTPEQILAIPPRVLTQSQRELYFTEGYILLEKIIGDDWLKKLRDATDELIERSRKVSKSDAVWDLEPDHTRAGAAAAPRVGPGGPASGVLGLRVEVDPGRRGRGPRGARRQVPPLQAQLQVGQGRRGGEVALRHLVLAAHQLLTAHGRDLYLRLRHGTGPGGVRSPEPPDRAALYAVRRHGQMGGMPGAGGSRRPSTSNPRSTWLARRARSRCTTAARCTAPRRTPRTWAARCCSTR